jgi:hypothetical protein
LKITKVTQTFGKSYALILAKNGLGFILGYFLTNSSVHPERRSDDEMLAKFDE